MSTTAKTLVVVSCLVIFWSGIDRVSNMTPPPEPLHPTKMPGFSELAHDRQRREFDPDDMGPHPRSWLWQERLVRATDYEPLVEIALPAARAGNADAQYALYRAFSTCRDGLPDMRAHCDTLAARYPDLVTEAESWLTKSRESKFPRALAFTALEDVRAMQKKPPPKNERLRRVQVARENLVFALRSNDPSITGMVPDFLPALFPGDPQVERAQWVWRLAACEQGLECGPRAAMLLQDCHRHDRCIEGEAAPEYIRRVSGDFPSLIARARNLARALRKSQLDANAFDASVTSLSLPGSAVQVASARILEQ